MLLKLSIEKIIHLFREEAYNLEAYANNLPRSYKVTKILQGNLDNI